MGLPRRVGPRHAPNGRASDPPGAGGYYRHCSYRTKPKTFLITGDSAFLYYRLPTSKLLTRGRFNLAILTLLNSSETGRLKKTYLLETNSHRRPPHLHFPSKLPTANIPQPDGETSKIDVSTNNCSREASEDYTQLRSLSHRQRVTFRTKQVVI